ncbi:hypothetical protein [Cellulomonas dongxiuzhuiae]|uniref:hypothetical protein n=1 Tax=Cellulomonas dongxiuzhuiae TaxID=2819979 RepID=UPI001AAE7889|nr:hypothetical protein [Cellulomonas dongxiuzhuiae]MBO3087801.1 hypothetical protein [Cellulomonas dongxiuzhuiae]
MHGTVAGPLTEPTWGPAATAAHLDPAGVAAHVRDAQRETARFRMGYEFGIEEMLTKIRILRSEFRQTHDHNPIEHVTSRLKSMDSIIDKAVRYGCATDLPTLLDAAASAAELDARMGRLRDEVRDLGGDGTPGAPRGAATSPV